MTLTEAKRNFRKEHPNLRVNGWDERDYRLWSMLQYLPSYGIIAGTSGRLVSLRDVVAAIEKAAEERFKEEWRKAARDDRP